MKNTNKHQRIGKVSLLGNHDERDQFFDECERMRRFEKESSKRRYKKWKVKIVFGRVT